MENVNSKNTTDITEFVENETGRWVSECDVSEYNWILKHHDKSDGRTTKVHFYKKDMNDISLSLNLSPLIDRTLKEYTYHLIQEEKDREEKRDEEIVRNKENLLDEKIGLLIDDYELFIKERVLEQLDERGQKHTLTNLRVILDENMTSHNLSGVHNTSYRKILNKVWINQDWYLKNHENLVNTISSICPEYKPQDSKPLGKNQYGCKFININDHYNNNCNSDNSPVKRFEMGVGWSTQQKIYGKLIYLYRKLKTSKINYWSY